MDSKLKKITTLHGSVARSVFFRAFFMAGAMSIIPLVHILSGSYMKMFNFVNTLDCGSELGVDNVNLDPAKFIFQGRILNPIWGTFNSDKCKRDVNLTVAVVRELMGEQLLTGDKALCVGQGSAAAVMALQDLGFPNALGVYEHRFFSMKRKQFVYEINYEDKSFDFVFCRDLDKVSVPALLVLEIERVLKPGGIGAVLVGSGGLASISSSLIRSATPITSMLKSSSVVHVNYISNFTLIVFRKSYENAGLFEQYRLPADCQSLTNNRPLIEKMEPLVKDKPVGDVKVVNYLPNFIDVSSKKRMAYIDIGAAEHLKSNATNWFLPSYPITHNAFHVYFVDHNTSVLLSYVRKPGITFVYHPGLAGSKDNSNVNIEGDAEPFLADEGFDFLTWFKETVQHAEFVVLKMNAGSVELKFIRDLFETRAICFVDELFLHCNGHIDGEGTMPVDCMDIFKSLRSSGVYVHQWWGEDNPVGALRWGRV